MSSRGRHAQLVSQQLAVAGQEQMGVPCHIVWGRREDQDSASGDASASADMAGRSSRTETRFQRAESLLLQEQDSDQGSAAAADSSGTPQAVVHVDCTSSQTNSSFGVAEAPNGSNHRVFSDDNTSETSDDRSSKRHANAGVTLVDRKLHVAAGGQNRGRSSCGSSDSSRSDNEGGASSAAGAALPSAGSILHEAGKCKPCLFVHSKVGCQNDKSCQFCHLAHRRREKPRPCKGKRDRYKSLIDRTAKMQEEVPAPNASGAGDAQGDWSAASFGSTGKRHIVEL